MSNKFKKERFTLDYIKQTFEYDPSAGVVLWATSRPDSDFKNRGSHVRFLRHKAGKIAGVQRKVTDNLVYQYINVHDTHIYAHHIAWFIVYGRWPYPMLDHIDGNGLNNRIDNLVECVSRENQKNTKMYKSNKSGVTGVTWQGDSRIGFTAYIGHKNLGSSLDLFEACCRRKSAEIAHGYSERNGK